MADKESGTRKIREGQPLDATRLVEYGEGAVVSRTLLETKSGSVTLFAFDQGQGLSEHTAPFDALVHEHTRLVCGLNECFVSGMLDGLGCTGLHAALDPEPGLCCVKIRPR